MRFGKVSCGSATRTHDRYDARDSYERARDSMGENVRAGNDDIDSNGRRFQETPPDIAATVRSLIKAKRHIPMPLTREEDAIRDLNHPG